MSEGNQFFKEKTLEQRLLARTEEDVVTGCWEFARETPLHNGGCPQITFEGRRYIASRVAYELWVSPIPKGLLVCHTCDNPRCIYPVHLWAGTQKKNMDDMYYKGRGPTGEKHGSKTMPHRVYHPPVGEENQSSKLTEERVRYIRMWYAEGFSQISIAKAFGISQIHVSQLVRRLYWKHVK